ARCGLRLSHILPRFKILSIHRKIPTFQSENQIQKIRDKSDSRSNPSPHHSRDDRWKSKCRETNCYRCGCVIVDDNSHYRDSRISQEERTCERTTTSTSFFGRDLWDLLRLSRSEHGRSSHIQ